jgi:5S rRNA maturation endonuclease (ribonuclease M5)
VMPLFAKALLVCEEGCPEVEGWISEAAAAVVRVCKGDSAVRRVRREFFDVTVVISTGKEMDLAETVFNLRDIKSSMEIIIVADCSDASGSMIGNIAKTVPNTVVVNRQALQYLRVPAECERAKQRQKP